MIYRNQARDDFALYMDEETFEAIEALSPRPVWSEPVDFGSAFAVHRDELWRLLRDPDTHVYVAGVAAMTEALDAALAEVAGSAGEWQRRKAELIAGGRWVELLYA
jgi:ferredoxin--NADP+ reductase